MSALSKRQQARHERVLQQLLAAVPGNDRCADCDARNPGWASWNLGIFLCLRCASLHRKMGTHISKVKSLSMDSWSSEQIENMKNNGNTVVNHIYNPRNVKPPMPIDMDEADSVMERYIRQKYEKKSLVSGKSESPARRGGASYASPKPFIDRDWEREREPSPPPLPPKTKKFGFGLRSVSSTFHLSSPSSRMAPRQETSSYQKESTPRGSLTELSGDTMEEKIESLRDLGFMDAKKNATVLKGLNGNVDKAVEVLIRLGEGPRFSRSASASKPAGGSSNPFDKLDEKEKKPN
ncbi:hypothetical protein KEM56_004213 [Ascosphaera pollenicola]|nr:hypothetical protein KEM56_004213 [Ascosphaera pollenicola]